MDTLCGFKTAKATAVCFSGKEGAADGDYTKCADVSFYHVDFRPCMAPKFGEGSNVSITECHLHPQTDVTRAGKVEILGVDGKDLAGLVLAMVQKSACRPEWTATDFRGWISAA